jgi:hypothetical protein
MFTIVTLGFYTQQKYLLKREGKIKCFSDVQKLIEPITSSLVLLKMLRKSFEKKENDAT